MVRGLYTGYTGMLAQQKKMDTISNNLANVNTTGYKKENVVFQSFDSLYISKIRDPESFTDERIGDGSFGVRRGEIYTDFEQGSLIQTDDPYNLTIQGEGMFVLGSYDSEGNIVNNYTRDGSFGLNPNGQLVTKDGFFVMGTEGPITLSGTTFRIDESGKIYNQSEYIDTIQLTAFDNQETLTKLGSGIYETTDETIEKPFESQIIQGFVEGSNVNAVEEMVDMINVMRSYETNQKVITTYDSTLDKLINQAGRL